MTKKPQTSKAAAEKVAAEKKLSLDNVLKQAADY